MRKIQSGAKFLLGAEEKLREYNRSIRASLIASKESKFQCSRNILGSNQFSENTNIRKHKQFWVICFDEKEQQNWATNQMLVSLDLLHANRLTVASHKRWRRPICRYVCVIAAVWLSFSSCCHLLDWRCSKILFYCFPWCHLPALGGRGPVGHRQHRAKGTFQFLVLWVSIEQLERLARERYRCAFPSSALSLPGGRVML